MDNLAIWKSNSVRRQISALLLCCFLVSCAPALTLPLTLGEGPVPLSARWEKLRSGNQDTNALRAMADIDLMTSGRRHHLRVALQLQIPSLMRVEGIPVFGPPDFFLSLNREKLKIFLPRENKFYLGRPSRENFTRFLSISLSPEDMVYILLGLPPPLGTEGKVGYREYSDGDKRRLDRFLNNEIMQILWSDSNGERLTDMEITDTETGVTHRVSYGNYLRLGKSDMPQQVTITSKYGDTQIIVRYDDMELYPPESEKSFDLPIPMGTTPTSMDRD